MIACFPNLKLPHSKFVSILSDLNIGYIEQLCDQVVSLKKMGCRPHDVHYTSKCRLHWDVNHTQAKREKWSAKRITDI